MLACRMKDENLYCRDDDDGDDDDSYFDVELVCRKVVKVMVMAPSLWFVKE